MVTRTAILVTGTRVGSPTVTRLVADTLAPFRRGRYVVLLHGNYPDGADRAADELGRQWGWHVWPLSYFPDHDLDGGMMRNSALVSVLQTLVACSFEPRALAFPDDKSRGTWGCVGLVKEIGVIPEVHKVGSRPQRAAGA